jgi:hypothetical protein
VGINAEAFLKTNEYIDRHYYSSLALSFEDHSQFADSENVRVLEQ